MIAPPYWPREGEWERLAGAFPAEHTFVIVANDQGVDSAGSRDEAKTKLAVRPEGTAAVVEKVGHQLCIWK